MCPLNAKLRKGNMTATGKIQTVVNLSKWMLIVFAKRLYRARNYGEKAMPEKNKIKHSKVVEAILGFLLVLGVVLIIADEAMPDDEIWVGGIGLGLVLVILFYSLWNIEP